MQVKTEIVTAEKVIIISKKVHRKNTHKHWKWLLLNVLLLTPILLALILGEAQYKLPFFADVNHYTVIRTFHWGYGIVSEFTYLHLAVLMHTAILIYALCRIAKVLLEKVSLYCIDDALYLDIWKQKSLGERNLDKEEIDALKKVFVVQLIFALLFVDLSVYYSAGGEFIMSILPAIINILPFSVSIMIIVLVLTFIIAMQFTRYRRSKEYNVPARMIFVDYAENFNTIAVTFMVVLSIVLKALCLLAILFLDYLQNNLATNRHALTQQDINEIRALQSILGNAIPLSIIVAFVFLAIALYFVKPSDKVHPSMVFRFIAKIKSSVFTTIWLAVVFALSLTIEFLRNSNSSTPWFLVVAILSSCVFLIKLTSDYVKTHKKSNLLTSDVAPYATINTVEITIDDKQVKLVLAFRHSKNSWIGFEVVDSKFFGGHTKENEQGYTVCTISTRNFHIISLEGLKVSNFKGNLKVLD